MKKLTYFVSVALLFVITFSVFASADSTMFCKECGEKIASDSKFCQYCGAKVSAEVATENNSSNTSKQKDSVDEVSTELTEEEKIYQKATEYLEKGKYTTAISWFKKNPSYYKDTKDMINECYYRNGKYSFENGLYENASAALKNCKGYKDTDELYQISENNKYYNKALDAIKNGDYSAAYLNFGKANGIYDSNEYLSHIKIGKHLAQEKYIISDNLGNKSSATITYNYEKGKLFRALASGNVLAHFSRDIMTWAHEPYAISSAQKETYYYNEDGSLKSIEGTSGSSKIYVINYVYDDSGRITAEDVVTNTDSGVTYYNYNSDGSLANVRIDKNYDPSTYFYYNADGTIRQMQTNIAGYIYTIDYKYEYGLLKERNASYYYQPYLKEVYEYDEENALKSVTYDYYDKNNGSVKIEYIYSNSYLWEDTIEDDDAKVVEEQVEVEPSGLPSGEILMKKYGDNPSTLTIANTTGKNCYVLLFSNHGVSSLAFYVRAGENCAVEAPIGTYYLYIVTGDNWEDNNQFFGDSSKYYKINEPYTCFAGTSTDAVLGNNLNEISKNEFPLY